jgi:hypothetical protein
MPHVVGPVSVGRTCFCSHCGALYLVRPSKIKSTATAKCVICSNNHEVECERVPIFKLIQRPEDA